MTRHDPAAPARSRTSHDDLNQLKRQAKDLLKLYRGGDAEAQAEVQRQYHQPEPATFALHDAQLVIARRHGFESWAKLKQHVDRATAWKLADAARTGDVARIRAMLRSRPELVNIDFASNNEHRAIHFAVLHRQAEAVRVLMEAGADARKGIYPHRDATAAYTIAKDRGYDEIIAIIETEEQHRREAMSCPNATVSPVQDELNDAISRGDESRARQLLDADPTLIRACDRQGGTPLHAAAGALDAELVAWLQQRGADVKKMDANRVTPLDRAVLAGDAGKLSRLEPVARLLLDRGAAMTARAAVALGDAERVKALGREASNARGGIDWVRGGLLSLAVRYGREEMVALLLDLGLDVDERVRLEDLEEETWSWGMPLWHAAGSGRREIAELLLSRGADPNGQVYASGTPVFQAYAAGGRQLIELLTTHGGIPDAPTAGLFRDVELARRMLDGELVPLDQSRDGWAGESVAEQMLWGAACGGSPQIVAMSLQKVQWPRDDRRWFRILEEPLRMWKYGTSPPPRESYFECFQLILPRADANVIGRFGRTILHSLAGSRSTMAPPERTAFAELLLNAGARLDVRDEILRSTPLGWACRWGRVELVRLLLDRGASAEEPQTEPWARPIAWAQRMGHADLLGLLTMAS